MNRVWLLTTWAVASISSLGGAAWSAEPGAERASESSTVGEVIVTATKRETKLEQTPIAITAISGAAIDSQHIDGFGNIALTTPSLVFTALSRQESYPSIRGTTVGNDSPGSDLGVSVFIDDIPTTGVADNDIDLFDIQGIEVLRGPQGTLFGENVTGGALSVHTLPPSFTPHEKAEFTYGNYDLLEARGYVTGPIITDVLAGKITMDVRSQGGIINDPITHSKTDSTRLGGVRAQLLWTPNGKLRVLAGGDFNVDSSPYKNQQLIGDFQPAAFPHLYYGPSDTDQAISPKGDAKTGGAFVRTDYALPFGEFSTITGYRKADSRDFFSVTADPDNEQLKHYHVAADQITEEIHLLSKDNQRLTWLAGLFFLDERRLGDSTYNYNINPETVAVFSEPYNALVFNAYGNQAVHIHDYAAFADATYAITSAWKFEIGARYTIETKSGHSEVGNTSGDPIDPANNYYGDIAAIYSHTWSAFNPKGTITFEPNHHFLAYATVASGFKSGGYDLNAITSADLGRPFQPETVVSYEVGTKVAVFDERLIVNAAAYYAAYKNLQVTEFNPVTFVSYTGNAGTANIPGVELEIVANPTNWLTLNGNYSYMDNKYTKYIDNGGDDFSGNKIPFDTNYHYTLGGEIHFDAPRLAGGEIRLGGDITYQGKKYFDDANDDATFVHRQTSIDGQVNLHLNWTSTNRAVEISLWANNVTNKRYLINLVNATAAYADIPEYFGHVGSIYLGDWNEPAMYGLSVTFKH